MSYTDRLRDWLLTDDAALMLGVMIGLYALFTVFGTVLGLNFAGIVSTLQQITFFAAVYALLALALNLQWGYAGLLNIGVAGFMAVAVYTMAMLTAPVNAPAGGVPGLGLPIWVGILGGMLVAAVAGGVVALPALRLKADYFAIVTLAFAEIIRITYNSQLFQTFSVAGFEMGTGASRGIPAPTNPVLSLYYTDPSNYSAGTTAFGSMVFGAFGAIGLDEALVVDITYTLILIGFLVLYYVLLSRIANSPFGRVLKAIRNDELVARSLGKNTRWFKIKTFMLGCALMGFAGILWQGSQSLITPTQFTPMLTFYIFIALIIGGAGSNTGSVIGGALFAGLLFQGPVFVSRIVETVFSLGTAPNTFPDAVAGLAALRVEPLLAYTLSNLASLRFVIVGLVLIYLMLKQPTGILGHRKEIAASIDITERVSREGSATPPQGEVNSPDSQPGDSGEDDR
ncbi:branched-chain amino acid ABC transporter permease [Halostella sp. PRR32]|uniref:branched-chain amino acid ABC transporter permease n=1 Tax=Halostella sp. PRR32 TaxID=3098147 RepID=UPI002B1DDC9C|nr:branched-chain amino acid ABC transporter permease [Halostella sp. PRR32]